MPSVWQALLTALVSLGIGSSIFNYYKYYGQQINYYPFGYFPDPFFTPGGALIVVIIIFYH